MKKTTDSEQVSSNPFNNVDDVVERVTKLPPHEQEQAIEKLEMYSGPIPHPDILKKHDDIDPGVAKLIIENGVEESKHRRSMENQALAFAQKDRKRRD